MTIYQMEQNKIFNYILNQIYFSNFQNNENKTANEICLNLTDNILSICNNNCYYSNNQYNYQSNNTNEENIIINLNLLLNFLEKNNLFIEKLSLFAEEIWSNQFGINVLENLYNFYKKYKLSNSIILSSNMNWINNVNSKIISDILDKFNVLGIKIIWNTKINLENNNFNIKLFELAQKYNIIFNININFNASFEKIKENFKQFIEYKNNYNYQYNIIESKENNWTKEKIIEYLDLLQYIYNIEKNITNSINNFSSVLQLKIQDNKIPNCSVQQALHIKLSDLSIIPCQNINNDIFYYGQFEFNNEKIINIQAINPELCLYLSTLNPKLNHPICDTCIYNELCEKGCLKCQLDEYKDLAFPCNTICELQKQKIKFLINLYQKEGLLENITDEKLKNEINKILKEENKNV